MAEYTDMREEEEGEGKGAPGLHPTSAGLYGGPPSTSLTTEHLEKMGLSHDVDIGDYLNMKVYARVRNVIKQEIDNKPHCHVLVDLTHIAPGEDEPEPKRKKSLSYEE